MPNIEGWVIDQLEKLQVALMDGRVTKVVLFTDANGRRVAEIRGSGHTVATESTGMIEIDNHLAAAYDEFAKRVAKMNDDEDAPQSG